MLTTVMLTKGILVNPITMNLVADDIIRFALREDMNAGDLSTESVCSGPREAEVQLIAKAAGVIAGLDVFERAFTLLDPATTFDARVSDGDEVEPRSGAGNGARRRPRAALR